MILKILLRRGFTAGLLLFIYCGTLASCAFADEQSRAMQFLQKSVKERDAMLLEQIREDEKLEEAKELAGINDFLAKDLVKVESLNIKARPITKQSAVKASVINYQKTGNVEPILVNNDLILYPYGLSEPTLVCAPLRICHIELESGEEIIDTSPGDTQRWWFGYTFVGEAEGIQPHVLVKPLIEGNIETTLSISTNKRLYYIILKSVLDGTYTKRIGFFYPQEYKGKAKTLNDLKAKLFEYKKKDTFDPLSEVPVGDLSFEYDIKGSKRSQWYPVRVFNDGKKVYIQMPASVQAFELPVFMIIGKDKQYEAVNYRYHSPYYIVDRLFDKGVLLLTNSSRKEEKIIIVHNKR